MIEGPRGGLYFIPPDGEADDGAGAGEIEPGDELTTDQLEPGMEVEIFDEPAEIVDVHSDAGPDGEAAVEFVREDGEDFAIFEDLLEGEIQATEATSSGNSGDDSGGEGGEDGDPDADTEGPAVDPDADPVYAEVVETFDSEAAPDELDLTRAESVNTLGSKGIAGGHAADDMRVATMPDGSEAFARGGPDVDGVEETAAIGQFMEAVGGNVATAHYDADSNVMVSEGLDGELVDEADPEDIDTDSLTDAYAVSLLAGNADLHGSNLMVQEGGEVALFDYDFGGNPMFGDTEYEGQADADVMQMTFQENVEWSLVDAGLDEDLDHTEVANEALERAQEIAADVDADGVTEHISEETTKQAMRENVERLQEEEGWQV